VRRRAELLRSAGFTFEVMPADVDETPGSGESASAYTLRVATDKARVVSRRLTAYDAVILAADTEVALDCRIFGKPADDNDAAQMLRTLSGAVHDVLTAVVISTQGHEVCDVIRTRVQMARLSDEDIAWYVKSGEPMGKAGAYGIQGRGARFVERIEGSWSNVVGLPVHAVHRLLAEAGRQYS
jgi:septum formation protein